MQAPSHYSMVADERFGKNLRKIARLWHEELAYMADTFVGTGSSGLLAIGALRIIDPTVPCCWVRKPGEDSHGSAVQRACSQDVGGLCVFLDDLIDSGRTLKRVASTLFHFGGRVVGIVTYADGGVTAMRKREYSFVDPGSEEVVALPYWRG